MRCFDMDTSDQAHEVQIRVLQAMGPEKRSLLAAQWSDEMRETSIQGIRDRHGFNDRRAVIEYARITLGEELFLAAFAAELNNGR